MGGGVRGGLGGGGFPRLKDEHLDFRLLHDINVQNRLLALHDTYIGKMA